VCAPATGPGIVESLNAEDRLQPVERHHLLAIGLAGP
jgi:hypothetical protein